MRTIDVEKLKELREKESDLLVLNALPEEAFVKEHIPGSKSAPVGSDDFLERVEELSGGKKDRPIVVYCADADCQASPKAAKKLEEAGYARVYDFEGGMKAWREADLKVHAST